ncbi:MAG TPA: NAD(P)H-dependent oxidoreductase [Polyangia bacterium]|nr:NAD(P)H-dependent oxidoreductase [Polyangia bacterium]
MTKVKVLIASVREERKGDAVANWFVGKARSHDKVAVELIDLKQLALPLLDEPSHPIRRQYKHEHTKAWSRMIADGDAFVFVTPEYNHGMPPALLNAVDYLWHEWNYKPVAFVSYGGLSGGTRGVLNAQTTLLSVKLVPIVEAVALPFFNKQLKEDGTFDPGDTHDKDIGKMLDELVRYATALQPLRG